MVPFGAATIIGLVRWIVVPSLRTGRVYIPLPGLAVTLLLAVVLVIAIPELYLLTKAVKSVHDRETHMRYRGLMIVWPYALVAPYVAVATRALPKVFLDTSDDDGSQPALSEAQWRAATKALMNRVDSLTTDVDIQAAINETLRNAVELGPPEEVHTSADVDR